ncbi:MAG: cisplatin damage response ATP-dependent DNA ligase [Saprospiraceae bacterium]
MNNFVTLIHVLDSNSSHNAKVLSLLQYLEIADPQDVLCMVSLFVKIKPKRAVTLTLLKEWAVEMIDLPDWLFEESHKITGDMAETIAILLPEPSMPSRYSLNDILANIKDIAHFDDGHKKEAITKLWKGLDRDARFLFNKLLTGGFRFGEPQKVIIEALSKYLNEKETIINHRLMRDWNLDTTTFQELLTKPHKTEGFSKPYPFYLASTLKCKPQKLGPSKEWTAEYKWEGFRSQIIKRKGEIYVWTRDEELVTQKYPEFSFVKNLEEDDFVMDGQIIFWKNNKPGPLSELEKRTKRKTISKKQIKETPAAFIAHDLFEYQGNDFRSYPYHKRRHYLNKMISSFSHNQVFFLSDEIAFKKWNEISDYRNKARSIGADGLMIKRIESAYYEGRKEGSWWKWKVDDFTVNAVLLYANSIYGRKSNEFSEFTFAVKDEGRFVPFAKAYGGLSEEELSEIVLFIKSNTLESFGPVRSIAPKLVFELSFANIFQSKRHKCGIVVKHPKIKSWRKDLNSEDVNTLRDLTKLLQPF